MDLQSFILTYAYGPGTRVKTPMGEGTMISVMAAWNCDNEIMYSVALDDDRESPIWVFQKWLMDPNMGDYEVTDIPEPKGEKTVLIQ